MISWLSSPYHGHCAEYAVLAPAKKGVQSLEQGESDVDSFF
jgi:hypothetical protein